MLYVGLPFVEQYELNSFTVPTVTTGVGNSGSGIALDATTNTVYSTGCITEQNSAGGTTCSDYLFVIDGATVKLVNKIHVNGAEGVAVDQQTNMVYVAAGNSIAVISGATDQLVANVTAQSVNIAVDPTTDMIYTDYFSYFGSTYGASSFTVINGTTDSVVTTLPSNGSPGDTTVVGGGLGAGAIAVDAATDKIYVASAFSAQANGSAYSYVSVINGANNLLVQNVRITETDGSGVTAVAVDSQANKVYVSTWGGSNGGDVAMIDGSTDSVMANIHLSSGSYGVAVDGNTHTVFASLSLGTAVQVISGATDSIVAQATFIAHNVGQVPSGVVFDSTSDTLYVACEGAIGAVSAIGNMPTS